MRLGAKIAALSLLMTSACASRQLMSFKQYKGKALRDIWDAQSTIKAAQDAGAGRIAPKALSRARLDLDQAKKRYDSEEYWGAYNSAESAIKLARRALDMAKLVEGERR